jgi:hypothetical protein
MVLPAFADPESHRDILPHGRAFGPFPAERDTAVDHQFVAGDEARFPCPPTVAPPSLWAVGICGR